MPGVLREPAGVRYGEYANLIDPVPVSGTLSGAATAWADGLVAEGADVLARYEHPHFGEFPAVTTHEYGAGRVTYAGTVPDRALARSLSAWLAAASLPPDPWRRSDAVRVTAARGDGRTLRFVHNWSWEPAALRPPAPVRDLLTGERVESLALGRWDVRVLEDVA
jgi:beta-galactosidase